MNELKRTTPKGSPRSGRRENSPALQCWVRDAIIQAKPVKRAIEVIGYVQHIRKVQPSALRTMHKVVRSSPSDESLGYFRTSAPRTIFTFVFLVALVVPFTNSRAFGQTAASASPTPEDQTLDVPPVATTYRGNPNKPLPSLSRVGVDTSQQRPLT